MIKILYVLGGPFDYGGISSFVINYYRHFQMNDIHIDFVVHGYERGIYDDEVEKRGSKIFHLPIKSKHPIKHALEFKKILMNGKYDIVHSHLDAGNYTILKIAKKCGVKIRISHSHNTDYLCENWLKRLINSYYRKRLCSVTTHNLACSNEAGKWLYANCPFIVFKNAIEIYKYEFDQKMRDSIRVKLSLGDNDIVIGFVGRFDYQKNHIFFLDTFKELLSIHSNYKLVLIGDGKLKEQIIKRIGELNISDKVIIVGRKLNVNEYYNSFDVFVLPSLFEGLGIVAIEAQANGLPCVLSNSVPREAFLLKTTVSLPLDAHIWVQSLLSIKKYRNTNSAAVVKDAGYDIEREATKLENYYFSLIQSSKR